MLRKLSPTLNLWPFGITFGWWNFWTQKPPLVRCWKRHAAKKTGRIHGRISIFLKNITPIWPSDRKAWRWIFSTSFWCIGKAIFAAKLHRWWGVSLCGTMKFIGKNCLRMWCCRLGKQHRWVYGRTIWIRSWCQIIKLRSDISVGWGMRWKIW